MNLTVNARDAMPTGQLLVELGTSSREAEVARAGAEAWALWSCQSPIGAGCARRCRTSSVLPTKGKRKGTGWGWPRCAIGSKAAADRGRSRRGGTRSHLSAKVPRCASASDRRRRSGRRRSRTVLLVEDEGSIREAGRRMLRKVGYTVIEAARARKRSSWRETPGPITCLTDVVSRYDGGGLAERLTRCGQAASPYRSATRALELRASMTRALPRAVLEKGAGTRCAKSSRG